MDGWMDTSSGLDAVLLDICKVFWKVTVFAPLVRPDWASAGATDGWMKDAVNIDCLRPQPRVSAVSSFLLSPSFASGLVFKSVFKRNTSEWTPFNLVCNVFLSRNVKNSHRPVGPVPARGWSRNYITSSTSLQNTSYVVAIETITRTKLPMPTKYQQLEGLVKGAWAFWGFRLQQRVNISLSSGLSDDDGGRCHRATMGRQWERSQRINPLYFFSYHQTEEAQRLTNTVDVLKRFMEIENFQMTTGLTTWDMVWFHFVKLILSIDDS